MSIPITVLASTRPHPTLLHHTREPGTALVAAREVIEQLDPADLVLQGRVTVSDPDTYFRSPGCPCCAVREDLVASVVRATQRAELPGHVVVIADPTTDDLLTAVTTLLSSFEISRRCHLDAVVLQVDAVELATRLTTGGNIVDGQIEPAVAIADRIVIDGDHHVTNAAFTDLRAALIDRSGFARSVDSGSDGEHHDRLDAWHGAPTATPIDRGRDDAPATIVLRVDAPLDPEAIDGWLDLLVARHASRLFRIQGALSVVGNAERTCCYGVRSFAISHSERDHPVHRSTESVLAICGVGLDADELAASFESTVAS